MKDSTDRVDRRPWRNLILAFVGLMLALLALALWSEREDARRLPPGEMEGAEETSGVHSDLSERSESSLVPLTWQEA